MDITRNAAERYKLVRRYRARPHRLADLRGRRRATDPPPRPSHRTCVNRARRARDAGLTAYSGLLEIGRPKPGEMVTLAAATGPVGSAVGQITRIYCACAVGITGDP